MLYRMLYCKYKLCNICVLDTRVYKRVPPKIYGIFIVTTFVESNVSTKYGKLHVFQLIN